ncbi:putative baseplate assembly protein [uncultured Chitinophaga sp.]|jgi:conserved hypothetical protein, phage tail-like region|uniref:putative baseplate assembly protein n=1 Tax=uncultured Chitinophaga sp. TaxID=339340 RepID=UPI00261B6DBF|nr:putative baseplate assembly protein [uncultured Chitinophaga sp.]
MQDTCNCCTGLLTGTPLQIYNRPGLQAIAYRAGTYATFRDSLLARLSGADQHALLHLTARNKDDFTIALLDAWSAMGEVLTFYQERIANESYLRTATERFSVFEQARLIGYELRPGAAAGTFLAFTLEDAPGALGPVLSTGTSQNPVEGLPPITIAAGVKIQSIPGPGETAQLFETVAPIEARPQWNAIRPRLKQLQLLTLDKGLVILDGAANDLKKGDVLLLSQTISGVQQLRMRKILSVSIDTDAKTTRVELSATSNQLPVFNRPVQPAGDINIFNTREQLDESVITQIISSNWKEDDLAVLLQTKKWSAHDLVSGIAKAQAARQGAITSQDVFVFRKQAAIFGYNAPKEPSYNGSIPKPPSQWTEWDLDAEEADGRVFLDNAYEEVLAAGYIGLQKDGKNVEQAPVFKIQQTFIRPRTAYGLSGKSTQVAIPMQWKDVVGGTVHYPAPLTGFGDPVFGAAAVANQAAVSKLSVFRDITVYAQSVRLSLAELPIEDVIAGDTITLNSYYPGLKTGQLVIVTGDRHDLKGATTSEMMTIREVLVEGGYSVLVFTASLAYTYTRSTVNVNANVAPATHGETVQEVLGSGDAAKAFQQFTLRQPPLTYTRGASASGVQSTLEIRVNDLLWKEVPNFLDRGPDERIYITRRDDEGKTTVTFGDGITGARLPTGQENVKAKYRKGIGTGGAVKARQLSQLVSRPLGVKSALNPVPAIDAADPEQLADARRNAPLTILTLDRIVSLLDYEDFARAYTGVEKALATWTWQGQKRTIFITVAGAEGAAIKSDSELYKNLLDAIRKAGDPRVTVTLSTYVPQFFRLSANLKIHPDHLTDKVLGAVSASLQEAFSFAARNFGQAVHYSEVAAVIQAVEGVIAVDIDSLYRADDPSAGLHYTIPASMPVTTDGNVTAAELLLLDHRHLDLKVII